ncbi:hypothetical protein Q5752_002943 [Cryptotrichosporon argae]
MVQAMADFLRRRGRTATEQDEWFVPYRPPNAPLSSLDVTGVRRSPSPARPSRSIFGALGSSLRRARTPGAIPRSASLVSLPQAASMGRLASSNSVPTGLVAPKMLFSPLGREIRESYTEAGPSGWRERYDQQHGQPVQRAPATQHAQPTQMAQHGRQYEKEAERSRRPSDTKSSTSQSLPFSSIGPDVSPEMARALDQSRARDEERAGWEEVVRRRGRSLSFGKRDPPLNAPIIGNARARSRSLERSRDRSGSTSSGVVGRARASSFGSLFKSSRGRDVERPSHDRQLSQPPGSFGFFSRRPRLPSSASQPSLSSFRHNESFDASRPAQHPGDPFYPHERSEGLALRKHQHTRSDPDLLGRYTGTRQAGTPRQLTFTQEGRGVVIINATPKKQQPVPDYNKPLPDVPTLLRTASAAPSSNVLPSSSHDTALFVSPSSPGPPTSYLPMPDAPPLASSSQTQTPRTPADDPSPAHAHDYLIKQHQRALTKRAFQTPVGSTRSATSGSFSRPPLSAGALQTTFANHAPQGTPTPANARGRSASLGAHASPSRIGALVVGSSPGLAVTSPSGLLVEHATTPSSPTRPGPPYQGPPLSPIEARMKGLARVELPRSPMSFGSTAQESPSMSIARHIPPMAAQYVSVATARQPVSQLAVPGRPAFTHAASSMSGISVYTDATEGYGRSEGMTTPLAQPMLSTTEHGPLSPIGSDESISTPRHSADDRDFKGLFFRTPADPMTPQSPAFPHRPSVPRANFPRISGEAIGLGYALDQSTSTTASGPHHGVSASSSPLSYQSRGPSQGQSAGLPATVQQASRDRVPRHPSESQSEATFELSTPIIVEAARVPIAHVDLESRLVAHQLFGFNGGRSSRQSRRDSVDTAESYTVDLGDIVKQASEKDMPDSVVVRLSRVTSGRVAHQLTATPDSSDIAVRKHRSFSADVADPQLSPTTFGVTLEYPDSPIVTLRAPHTSSDPPSPTDKRIDLGPPLPPVPPVSSVALTPSSHQPHQLSPIAHSPDQSSTPASGYSPVVDARRRSSTAISLIGDFPSPPTLAAPTMATTLELDMPDATSTTRHASAFGQLVTGPPGAGKSTYCHGMHQFLTALGRPVAVINLDPAVEAPPYPCALNITDLISIDEIMDTHGLGPNGAILYAVEYLEANIDWLIEGLDKVLESMGGNGYVVFDTPGQVELWTNHDSLKRIIERLTKMEYRLVAVHLSDAHYITDASKFISVVLLALRAMLQLELPHVNVLSKMDLMAAYGSDLPFNLDYYTEVQDLGYLLQTLEQDPRTARLGKLNRAMCDLIEDFSLVGFETLAVEDKSSMASLLRALDKANGYVFVPTAHADPAADNLHALFASAVDVGDVRDVQERWIDRKDAWDEWEKEGWKKEWEQHGKARADGHAAAAGPAEASHAGHAHEKGTK